MMRIKYIIVIFFILLFSIDIIAQPVAIEEVVATNSSPCSYSLNGTVKISVTNSGPSYQYKLYKDPDYLNPFLTHTTTDTTWTFTGLIKSDYFVTAQTNPINANGGGVTVGGTDTIDVTFNFASPVNACDGVDLNIIASAIGGAGAPYSSYIWGDGDLSLTDPDAGASTTFNSTIYPASETYSMTVTDANTCVGIGYIQVNMNGNPTISLGASPTVCQGTAVANLPYGATTSNPDKYSITFNAAALAQGFLNVVDDDLVGSPIAITVPTSPDPSAATYNADLTVKNNTTGCQIIAAEAFTVTVNTTPDVDPLANVTVCDSYTLPVITGTNLTGNEAYYTVSGGGGIQYTDGQVINSTTTLYIYDESGGTPNCFDEESFTITVNNTPDINPLANVTACDSYTLPVITGTNLTGNEAYYTVTGGGGIQYNAGQIINADITLYIYDETATVPNCSDEEVFSITINTTPVVNDLADQTVCDSYVLPVITGTNLTGNEAYYTASGGGGIKYNDGQVINSTVTLYIYDETGTVPNCSDEESVLITVNNTPNIDPLANVTVCDSYTLPVITGTNLTGNEAYYTVSGGGGIQYNAGQIINSDITLYIYDETGTVPNCFDEESFSITVNTSPDVDDILPDPTVCDSYTLPAITGTNLTGGEAYYTATGGGGIKYNPGQIFNSTTTLYIYDETGTVPNCTDEEVFTITVNITPTVDDIVDPTVCDSYTLPVITGTNLTGNEAYYTVSGGGGIQYTDGQAITSTTTLYIYDETATTPNCTDEQNFTITVNNTPDINPLANVTACDSYTLPVITGTNLTGNEAYYTVTGGGGIQYNAGQIINADITLYIYDETATVPNCFDEEVFSITINTTPDVDDILPDPVVCDSYTLPVITGTNLTGNEAYYTASGGGGLQYNDGQVIAATTTLYLYDETGTVPNCSDEESVLITVNNTPVVDDIPDVTVCDSYTLPVITGINLTGNEAYYTVSGGGGIQYNAGQIINSDITLYIYDETGTIPNCFDEESFSITIVTSPDVDDILPDPTVCDSYTLPAITGTNLTGGEAYYTATGGGGTKYNPGQIFNSTIALFIYDETGTVPNCTDEESFTITVNLTPVVDDIVDPTVCDSYTLPVITGTNLTGNEAYYTVSGGGGIQYADGQAITSTTTLYIYDETGTTPNCFDEENFIITVYNTPSVGLDVGNDYICDGQDATISVDLTEPGVSYEIWDGAITTLIDGPIIGTGGTIYFTIPAADIPTVGFVPNQYRVLADDGGCSVILSDIANVLNYAMPDIATPTVSDPVICSTGSGVINITNTDASADYTLQLDLDDSYVDGPVSGNGATINFTVAPLVDTDYNLLVEIDYGFTICSDKLNDIAQVTVNPLPDNNLVVDDDIICDGQTGNIVVNVTQAGVEYTLRNGMVAVDGPVAGPGTVDLFDNPSSTTKYNIYAEYIATGCNTVLLDSGVITVNSLPTPGLSSDDPDNSICYGDNVIFTASGGNQYEFFVNAPPSVQGPGAVDTYATTGLLDNDNVYVIVTDANGCSSTHPGIPFNVDPVPFDFLNVQNAEVCDDEDAIIQVELSQNGVTYQLRSVPADADIGNPLPGNNGTLNLVAPAVDLPAGNHKLTVYATTGLGCNGRLTDTAFVKINGLPTITLDQYPELCYSAVATTGNLTYTGTTNGADRYDIVFGAAALAENFINVGNQVLGGTPIVVDIPADVAPGVYNATLTVTNSTTGCTSIGYPFTITINAPPTITLGANPRACYDLAATTGDLVYTNTTQSPDKYDIVFDPPALAEGFANVVNADLLGSPIVVNIPGDVVPDIYTATIYLTNTTTTCSSTGTPFTVQIDSLPDITLAVSNDDVCPGIDGTITITNSENTVDYQVRTEPGDVNVGGSTTGDGNNLDLTVPDANINAGANTFNVYATTVDGCSAQLTNISTITEHEPDPSLTITDDVVCDGLDATITVNLAENLTSYQVRTEPGNVDIPGASGNGTGANLNITVPASSLSTGNNQFNILATDGYGCSIALTDIVDIFVNTLPDPSITGTNYDTSICLGLDDIYTTEAAMAGYNWYISGTNGVDYNNLTGNTTSPTLNLQWLVIDTFKLSVNYTDGNGCTASAPDTAYIVVTPPTTIDVQPVPVTECEGDTAVFTISASGTEPINYAWFVDLGGGFVPVNGSGLSNMGYDNDTLKLINIDGTYNGLYRCIVSGPGLCGIVPSNTVALTVSLAPAISFSGLDAQYCEGNIADTLTGSEIPNGIFSGDGITDLGNGKAVFRPNMTGLNTIFYDYTYPNTCSVSTSQTTTVLGGPDTTLNVSTDTICNGETAIIELFNSDPNARYMLVDSFGISVGLPIQVGDGGTLQFPVMPSVTTRYQILAQNMVGNSCTAILQNRPEVYISSLILTVMKNDTVTCPGDADGLVSVTPSGGVPGFTYGWYLNKGGVNPISGETNSTLGGRNAGTYFVIVTDKEGCFVEDSAVVSDPPQIVITTINTVSPTCPGNNDGEAHFAVTGGTGSLTYTFEGFAPGTDTAYKNLTANDYDLHIEDSKGCFIDDIITVSDPLGVTVDTIYTRSVSCSGKSDGIVTVKSIYGSGMKTFNLYDGATPLGTQNHMDSVSFTNLDVSPNYWVEIIDACGSTNSDSVSIGVPAQVSILNASAVNMTCNGYTNDSLKLNITGGNLPYVYITKSADFSTTVDSSVVNMNPGAVTGIGAGTYWVIATDTALCTFDTTLTTLTITEPNPVVLTVNNFTNVQCGGQPDATIDVSGASDILPVNYSLFNNISGDTIVLGQATGLFNNVYAGEYEIRVTDANGCFDNTILTITQPPPVVVTFRDTVPETCYGDSDGSLTIQATGGQGQLTFTLQPGNISTTNNPATFNGLSQGAPIVEISDTSGCVWPIDFQITGPPPITIVSTYDTLVNDTTISIDILATGGHGGLTYSIKNEDGTLGPQAGGYFEVYKKDWYEIIVSDPFGCTNAPDSIYADGVPDLNVNVIVNSIKCYGDKGAIALVVQNPGSGNTTYINNTDTVTKSGTNHVFSGLSAGTYNIKVISSDLREYTTTVNLTEPALISVTSIVVDSVGCSSDTSGSIQVNLTGGTAPYTYILKNGTDTVGVQNTNTFASLGAGIYDLSVKDNNGCSLDSNNIEVRVMVNDPFALSITNIAITDVDGCYGDANGAIVITANGGVLPRSYSINGDVPSEYYASSGFNNLQGGSYTVYVKDSRNCKVSDIAVVGQPQAIVDTLLDVRHEIGSDLGSINIKGANGTDPLSYRLYKAVNDSFMKTNNDGFFPDLSAMQYKVQIRDSKGCTLDTVVEVLYFTNFVTTLINPPSGILNCYGDNVDLSFYIEPDNYYGNHFKMVDSAGIYEDIDHYLDTLPYELLTVPAATYFVEIYDTLNRRHYDTLRITQPPDLVYYTDVRDASCGKPVTSDGGIRAIIFTGGTSPYTYTWRTGGNVISNNDSTGSMPSGIYELTITDDHGCNYRKTDTIFVKESIDIGYYDNIFTVCPDDNIVEPEITPTGNITNYQWTPSDFNISSPTIINPVITVVEDTVYTLVMTTSLGCLDTAKIYVGLYRLPEFNITNGDTVGLREGVTLDLRANKGFSGYYWYPADINDTTRILTIIGTGEDMKYYAFAYDENGCELSDSIVVVNALDIIPVTGFSPNGDGRNDLWDIAEAAAYGENIEVWVFNRWGQPVFYSKGYADDQRWDGSKKNSGKALPIGTYYYIIKYSGKTENGPITIVK